MTNYYFKTNQASTRHALWLGIALIIYAICATQLHAETRDFMGGIPVNLPQPTPLSPEAAAVVQYSHYPVDYCSGMPTIDIPLYEVKSGDITIPLTLSYRSSGLKPGDASGWVGTGWVLNAEPGLVRTVNGLPDDRPNYGYLSCEPLNGKVMTQEELEKICKGWADYEPDKFSYKLLSQSGSFYCQHNQEHPFRFVTYPDDLLSVFGPSYYTFDIRDANGFQYNFGGNGNFEYSGDAQESRSQHYITRWMCNYIRSPRGTNTVYFSYEDMLETTPLFLKGCYILEDSITRSDGNYERPILTTPSGSYRVKEDGSLTKNYEPFSATTRNTPGILGYVVRRKALSTINFAGGSVRFVNDGENLEYFEVLNAEGKKVRRVDFYISTYNPSTVFTKLDSLRISAPGCKDRIYRFDYNEVGKVPDTGAYASVDYYGYYNGSRGDSIVPYVELVSQYFANGRTYKVKHNAGGPRGERDPKSEYARCGMLTKIISPEGALTEFEYEPNLGGAMVSAGGSDFKEDYHEGGGLRICRIRKFDNGVQREVRSYTYKMDPVFSGIPVFGCTGPGSSCCGAYLPYGQLYIYEQQRSSTDRLGARRYSRVRIINPNPISNIFHPNGMSVFYNHVEEAIHDDLGHEEVNEYHYTLPPFLWQESYPWHDRRLPYAPFDYIDTDRFLYYKLSKVQKLVDDKLVECKEFEYSKKEGTDAISIGIIHPFPYSIWEDNSNNSSGAYYFYGGYSLERGCSRMTKETTTRYDDNGKQFRIVKDYNYNKDNSSYSMTGTRHLSPIKITTTNSNGQKTIEEFLYPEDFDREINLNQDFLMNTNRLRVPLEYRVTENGNTQITRQKFEEEIFSRNGKYTNFESAGTYDYDSYGQLSYTCAEGEIPTLYVWGYNHQYLIAKIEKCDKESLLNTLGLTISEFYSSCDANRPSEVFMQKLNSLREKLPNSQVYTYAYEPLVGMTAMTTPNGMTTFYENDGFGRLLESHYYEDGKKVVLEKHDYNTPDNNK